MSGARGLASAEQEESQNSKGKGQKSKVTDPRPLAPGPQGEAEASFLKAIEVAQQQQAKSLEVRATRSLARLWQHQGKKRKHTICYLEFMVGLPKGWIRKTYKKRRCYCKN